MQEQEEAMRLDDEELRAEEKIWIAELKAERRTETLLAAGEDADDAVCERLRAGQSVAIHMKFGAVW